MPTFFSIASVFFDNTPATIMGRNQEVAVCQSLDPLCSELGLRKYPHRLAVLVQFHDVIGSANQQVIVLQELKVPTTEPPRRFVSNMRDTRNLALIVQFSQLLEAWPIVELRRIAFYLSGSILRHSETTVRLLARVVKTAAMKKPFRFPF